MARNEKNAAKRANASRNTNTEAGSQNSKNSDTRSCYKK